MKTFLKNLFKITTIGVYIILFLSTSINYSIVSGSLMGGVAFSIGYSLILVPLSIIVSIILMPLLVIIYSIYRIIIYSIYRVFKIKDNDINNLLLDELKK